MELYNEALDWQVIARVIKFTWVYDTIHAKTMLDEIDYDLDPLSDTRRLVGEGL